MKTLKKHEFTTSTQQTYDWDTLLNGKIYQVDEGTDFTCRIEGFVGMAKARASSRGQDLNIQITKDGEQRSVVLQAASEPDAAKGDAWKAHQKQLAVARKARKNSTTTEEDAAADDVANEE
jgi:hypothetical protein